jgi:hypothetical protein
MAIETGVTSGPSPSPKPAKPNMPVPGLSPRPAEAHQSVPTALFPTACRPTASDCRRTWALEDDPA